MLIPGYSSSRIRLKAVEEFKYKQLPIVEIFGNTLQGEGPRLRPAIFIRTGLCNFRCEGFSCTRVAPDGVEVKGCDTIQAVSPKFKNTWDYYSDFNDIVKRVQPLLDTNTEIKPDIIITGGEPTLHWNNKTFQQLLEYYITRGHHVTIESNGSLDIEFTRSYQQKIMFSLSVKLGISGEPERKRFNIPALQNILDNTTDSYFKFVVSPEDWDVTKEEIFRLLEKLPGWVDVYLMPLGETRDKQIRNTRFVFEKCAELGFSFSPRIHILAFDDIDGV